MLPLDPQTASRLRRADHELWLANCIIKPNTWPIDLVGCGDRQHNEVRR
jgi:hypothetical protein